MNTVTDHQPVTHWVQLLTHFLIPGALQGLAFYSIAASIDANVLNWPGFALWFLAIAPTCVYLITVPNDRWRSIAVSVVLGIVLSALLLTDARDSVGASTEIWVSERVVFTGIVCALSVIFVLLPFYRTRWQRRKPVTHYATLFELAWNQTVCVVIGLAFTALVAALMGLSVALFSTVGVQLSSLVFQTPLVGVWAGAAFATAIGVTRQSDTIVLGTRALILALLWVLIVVMLPVSAVFVVLVAVLGIENLDTGVSIALTVTAAAVIAVALCSARIGDGEEPLTLFQQVLTRGMAAMVLPLALLAAYALWIRITEHGWTGERVLAAVTVALCVLYGLGYFWAAVRQPRTVIPKVNLVMAGICTVVALVLLTPLLDPDRIGVADQMVRFNDGRTTADELDLGYLKFDSGRMGREALALIATRAEASEAPLNARLAELAEANSRYDLANHGRGSLETTELVNALEGGTLRLLRQNESGWSAGSADLGKSELSENRLLSRRLYEFSDFCLSEGRDCAYLMGLDDSVTAVVRTAPDSLVFYRLAGAAWVGEPADAFFEHLARIDSRYGLLPEEIDGWFAALDKLEVPIEAVQVPALIIGPLRVLQDEPVLKP